MNKPYGEPPTVQELINKLQQIENKNLPVYVRPKYCGAIQFWEEIPMNSNGISEMVSKEQNVIDRLVFLI